MNLFQETVFSTIKYWNLRSWNFLGHKHARISRHPSLRDKKISSISSSQGEITPQSDITPQNFFTRARTIKKCPFSLATFPSVATPRGVAITRTRLRALLTRPRLFRVGRQRECVISGGWFSVKRLLRSPGQRGIIESFVPGGSLGLKGGGEVALQFNSWFWSQRAAMLYNAHTYTRAGRRSPATRDISIASDMPDG